MHSDTLMSLLKRWKLQCVWPYLTRIYKSCKVKFTLIVWLLSIRHACSDFFLEAAPWSGPCVNDTSIRGIMLIYLQTPLCGSCPKFPLFAMLSKFLPCCVHPWLGSVGLNHQPHQSYVKQPWRFCFVVFCSQWKEVFEMLRVRQYRAVWWLCFLWHTCSIPYTMIDMWVMAGILQ